MCGVSGFVCKHGELESSTNTISRMIEIIKHRGPDDYGIVGLRIKEKKSKDLPLFTILDDGCDAMLGFTRLSVRDLSEMGHQPMRSPDGKVILSFNGEIYNSDQYRMELEKDNVRFKSRTDTEVVLYLYLKYGIRETASKLNGMFAICIIDMRINKLFLLRDRVGIKPLYYTVTEKKFAYSSEIKSFLMIDEFKPELSISGLRENFTFYKPKNNILLRNVYEVNPGEIIEFDLLSSIIRKYNYFDIEKYKRPIKSDISKEEYKIKLCDELVKCVNNQKVSDAKIGCQLSGGIDSSIVTYIAAGHNVASLKDSISIIFDGSERAYSEEKYMDIVNSTCDIDGHKKIIDEKFVIQNYERTLWHGDTVIGRPNSIGLLLLTKEAKKYVTVLLSGEGADELLGGYDMFTQAKEVEKLLRSKPTVEISSIRNQPEIIHSLAEYVVISQQKTNFSLCTKIMPDFNGQEFIDERIELYNSLTGSSFDKQIKYAMKTYLPELLLCQDKMSMANSIENRVPFLDNEFIECAFNTPEEYLIEYDESGKLQGKKVLKDFASQVFGKQFAFRRKMGFGLPYYRYFKSPIFTEYFYDVIVAGTRKRGILSAETLVDWYQNLEEKSWGECELFWKACSFEAWSQMFIDGRNYIEIG